MVAFGLSEPKIKVGPPHFPFQYVFNRSMNHLPLTYLFPKGRHNKIVFSYFLRLCKNMNEPSSSDLVDCWLEGLEDQVRA